jgi:hypothetical protein
MFFISLCADSLCSSIIGSIPLVFVRVPHIRFSDSPVVAMSTSRIVTSATCARPANRALFRSRERDAVAASTSATRTRSEIDACAASRPSKAKRSVGTDARPFALEDDCCSFHLPLILIMLGHVLSFSALRSVF